jgi:hypothetical protein
LNGLTGIEGLSLPKSMAGNLSLNGLTNAAGLTLPEYIEGSLTLSGLKSTEGLALPQFVGNNLNLDGLMNTNGLTLPESLGGRLSLKSKKKSYLIVKHGYITKWVARQPISIDEELLQKLFPNLPSDEIERDKFLTENNEVISRLFDSVEHYLTLKGDWLEEVEDPNGKAYPDWDVKANVGLDDGSRWL